VIAFGVGGLNKCMHDCARGTAGLTHVLGMLQEGMRTADVANQNPISKSVFLLLNYKPP
jgi:hypothetical protein